jgi:hypothetical protein
MSHIVNSTPLPRDPLHLGCVGSFPGFEISVLVADLVDFEIAGRTQPRRFEFLDGNSQASCQLTSRMIHIMLLRLDIDIRYDEIQLFLNVTESKFKIIGSKTL